MPGSHCHGGDTSYRVQCGVFFPHNGLRPAGQQPAGEDGGGLPRLNRHCQAVNINALVVGIFGGDKQPGWGAGYGVPVHC